ncbi:hypothetical protein GE061_010625 [Apolygus lucorum]|uniref:BolA n=1 Tax=Apolygus lucorum TaxID=248454 RepID=A0A6A4JQ41_APOLU|nr:hypothetical protein GE061_010625 [Apolygus lucorum]
MFNGRSRCPHGISFSRHLKQQQQHTCNSTEVRTPVRLFCVVPSLCSRFNPHLLHRGAPIQLRNMSMGPIATSITAKISNALNPKHLDVINESSKHNAPAGSESHFKVVVVSEEFENKMPLQRHRIINQLLDHEIKNGIHALSIVTRTPKEWEASDQKVESSPNCRGGFGK